MNLSRRLRNVRRVLLAIAVRRRLLRHCRPRLRLTALLRRRWRLSARRLVGLGRRRWRAALTTVNLPRRRRNGRRVLLATAVRRRHLRHCRPRLRLTALRLGRRRWRAKAVGYFSRVNTSRGARE